MILDLIKIHLLPLTEKTMTTEKEAESIREYLQEHPDGEVAELMNHLGSETIGILRSLHFIAGSKCYHVTAYGKRFILPVVVASTT